MKSLLVLLAIAFCSPVTAQDFPLVRDWEYRNRASLANPSAVAAADFNGDGRPDLAVASSNTNTVLVFLSGDAPLAWRDPVAYDTGQSPQTLVSGDFNGDKIPDLAAGTSTGFTILLGVAGGSFTVASQPTPGPVPRLAAGEFNGDGRTDLAAVMPSTLVGAAPNDLAVWIFLSSGNGEFSQAFQSPPIPNIGNIVAADLNGDRKLDIGVLAGSGVLLLAGRGDGNIDPPSRIGPGEGGALCALDLNNDGSTDLLVSGQSQVLFYAGNPQGDFAPPVAAFERPIVEISAILSGDFNGDGIQDAAVHVPGFDAPSTMLFIMGRPGALAQPQPFEGAASASIPAAVAFRNAVAFDLDGDGRAELLLPDNPSDRLVVMRNTGAGWDFSLSAGSGERFSSLTVADFNRDGTPDIVVFNGSNGTMPGFFSQSAGARVRGAVVSQPSALSLGTVGSGDFNGDGRKDLITVTVAQGAEVLLPDIAPLTLYPGEAGGGFEAPVALPSVPFAAVVRVADVDGDGIDDLVMGGPFAGGVAVALGAADGRLRMRSSGGLRPADLVIADVNRDGKPDVAMTAADGLQVLLGNGDGTFQESGRLALGALPGKLVAGDFDGDGRVDIIASYSSRPGTVPGELAFFRGNGDGFAEALAVPNPCGEPCVVQSMHAGDFDGDGKMDVLIVGPSLVLLSGNGDGTFRAPKSLRMSESIFASAVADLNGDGRPDLVLSGLGSVATYLTR